MSRPRVPKRNVWDDGVFKSGLCWMTMDTGDDEVTVLFQCPNNHRATIVNHSVDSNGDVNASVLCYEPTCGYHEFVTLGDWPLHWSKPAGEVFIHGAGSDYVVSNALKLEAQRVIILRGELEKVRDYLNSAILSDEPPSELELSEVLLGVTRALNDASNVLKHASEVGVTNG